jgi:hypothetical protein
MGESASERLPLVHADQALAFLSIPLRRLKQDEGRPEVPEEVAPTEVPESTPEELSIGIES